MQKTVLITGGSSGIGKAIGEFLHQKGYRVYGTSRNPSQVTDSVFPLLQLDVREESSIQSAIKSIIADTGRLDVVINNAGVGITGPLEEIPIDEIKNNFETNLFGPIAVIKNVLPQMRSQKSGLIINITSIAGYMGLPYRSVYSASKSALSLITEGLNMELKPFDIKVCNIAPGDFDTDIASRRFHTPLYQDSPYHIAYSKILAKINTDVTKGSHPKRIAILVEKIINDKAPKINYKAGNFLEKFSIFLKRILPDTVFERILYNHYK